MGKQHQTFQGEPTEVPVTKETPEIHRPADPKEPEIPKEAPDNAPDELPRPPEQPE